MGNSASRKAKKAARKRRNEIEQGVKQKKNTKILLLIGNDGVGKQTLLGTILTIIKKGQPLDINHQFTYNLKSCTMNVYCESAHESSAKYKHVNAMMKVRAQMRPRIWETEKK